MSGWSVRCAHTPNSNDGIGQHFAQYGTARSPHNSEVLVLGSHDTAATVAVKDLAAAKQFYGGTLGLEQIGGDGEEAVVYKTGASRLVVYRSQFAGTNHATAVNWSTGKDIDGIVKELSSKGVAFEHYDMPGLSREGDVHVAGTMRIAWFKDPEGNIHSLMSG